MIQVIVYSVASGRVRRVLDPEVNVPNVIAFLNQVPIAAGEARLVYNKAGSGADHLGAWQAAVSAHTGLIPSPLHQALAAQVQAAVTAAGKTPTTVPDRYCAIDGNNNIVAVHICDPACGDSVAGCTLIAHPSASPSWTFTPPSTFTPPVTPTKT